METFKYVFIWKPFYVILDLNLVLIPFFGFDSVPDYMICFLFFTLQIARLPLDDQGLRI